MKKYKSVNFKLLKLFFAGVCRGGGASILVTSIGAVVVDKSFGVLASKKEFQTVVLDMAYEKEPRAINTL